MKIIKLSNITFVFSIYALYKDFDVVNGKSIIYLSEYDYNDLFVDGQ